MEEKVYYIEFLFESGRARILDCKTEADYNEARVIAETSFGKAMVATFRDGSVVTMIAMKNVVALRCGSYLRGETQTLEIQAATDSASDEDSTEEDHF